MTTPHREKITKNDALCVLSVVSHGLVNGLGDPKLGQMCVEAAVCYAMGEDHGDEPNCVDFELRAEKIELNDDGRWSSDTSRAKGMQRIAIAQLGSRGAFSEVVYRESLARQLAVYQLAKWRKVNAARLSIMTGKNATPAEVEEASVGLMQLEFTSDTSVQGGLIGELAEATGLDGDKLLSLVAVMMVEACIEQKIPGTRFLHLAQSKQRMTLREIERHRARRAKSL